MKAPWSYVPALPAALGMVAGVLLPGAVASRCAFGATEVYLCFVAASLAAAVWLYLRKWHFMAFVAFFVAVGAFFSYVHTPAELPDGLVGEKCVYTATVRSASESPGASRYIVQLDSAGSGTAAVPTAAIRCKLSVVPATALAPVGSRMRIEGVMHRVSSQGLMPHQLDYDCYLACEGVTARCVAPSDGVDVVAPPSGAQALVNAVRDALYNGVVLSPVGSHTAAFVLAALLGDDSLLDDEVYGSFRAAGVAHVLALSGLHVGIVVSMLTLAFFPLRLLRRGRLYTAAATIVSVWAYCVVVGFTPSVVRASVMVSVFLMARQHGYSTYNSLLLSVLIILCINPYWLLSPGFQMSVCAVAAIVTFAPVVPVSWKRHPALYWLAMTLLIPVAAMAATGVVSAYYFGTFPRMFLVANVFVGLIFQWLLVLAVVLMLCTLAGWRFAALGAVVDLLYRLMSGGVERICAWGPAVQDIHFSAWVIVPYLACLAFVAAALRVHAGGRAPLVTPSIAALLGHRRGLLTGAAAMALATVLTARTTAETPPAAELYIPRCSGAARVVLCSQGRAWLLTDDADPQAALAEANSMYRDFLVTRGCPEGFAALGPSLRSAPFLVSLPYIVASDRVVYVADSDSLTVAANLPRVHYALVTRRFTGSIPDIVAALHPDTVLLAASVHPSRRKRFVRECADSVAYKDLRVSSVEWRLP